MLFLQFIFVLVLRAVYCQCCQYLLPSDGSGVYNATKMGEGVVHDVLARIEEANIFDSSLFHEKGWHMWRLYRDGEHLIASHGKYGIWGFDLLNMGQLLMPRYIIQLLHLSVRESVRNLA